MGRIMDKLGIGAKKASVPMEKTRKELLRDYYRSERWSELRSERFTLDNDECVLCARDAEVVHHRRYPEVLGTETVGDLVSLCIRCHHNFHFPPGLKEAREHLWSSIEDGVDCPVCDQLARKWLIKLHSGMAYWLLLLVVQYADDGDWVSVKELNHRAGMRGGD